MNYVVVGVAIFVLHDADVGGNEEGGSGADRVALLAQGSYACMYLISARSTILNSSESASEVAGLVRRVSELLERLSGCENTLVDEKVARSLVGWAAAGSVWSPLRLSSGSRETAGTETPYQPLRTSEDSDCFVSSRSQVGQGIEMGDIVGLTRSPIVSQDDLQSPAAFQSKSTPMTVVRLENLDVLCEKNTNEEVVDPFSERRLPSRRLLVRDLTLEVRQGMRVLITGPSGCGKSTLLRLIAHASRNPPCTHNISFAVAPELIVFCPQNPHLFKVRFGQTNTNYYGTNYHTNLLQLNKITLGYMRCYISRYYCESHNYFLFPTRAHWRTTYCTPATARLRVPGKDRSSSLCTAH